MNGCFLACPGCGNRFFKYRAPEATCAFCGTLVKNAILMTQTEQAAVQESFRKARAAWERGKQAPTISQEGREQDLKDLFG